MTRMRRLLILAACVVAILGVGVLDEATGALPDLTILYLAPIVFAVLLLGLPAALGLVFVVFAIEVAAHAFLRGYPPRLLILDSVIHALVMGIVAIALDRVLRQLRTIRELKAASDQDLDLAAGVHESFLTAPATERTDLAIGLRIQFLRVVGGDYYRVADTADGLFVCIADISGKGVSAALFTAVLDRAVGSALSRTSDVGDILQLVNASMVETLPSDRFVTLFACLVDDSGISYVNAGPEPPLVYHREANRRVTALDDASSVPLGILSENQVVPVRVPFVPGDIVLLVTDGVTESEALREHAHERLVALLKASAPAGAQGVCDAVMAAVHEDGLWPSDDIAIVAIERLHTDHT
jgi:phosphoserine phosphatase RsbU/P